MTRTDITFSSGETYCAAWLYRPQGVAADSAPRPIIVMAHGVAGVREARLDAFAERFTAEGYLCLVFDYRYFGASGGESRQLLSTARQREDWTAAIAYARTIDGADPNKIIVWGTSYGGGHVIVAAAEDHRIAGMIAQCPFTDGFASGTNLPVLTALKVGARAVADIVAAKFGRGPLLIPSAGEPGDVALMVSPDTYAGVHKLNPHELPIDIDVSARFALDIIRQFPGRHAKNVTCPAHFALCARDSVAPAAKSLHYAQQALRSEIAVYDVGHFDIYVDDAFEANIADQIRFLRHHFPIE